MLWRGVKPPSQFSLSIVDSPSTPAIPHHPPPQSPASRVFLLRHSHTAVCSIRAGSAIALARRSSLSTCTPPPSPLYVVRTCTSMTAVRSKSVDANINTSHLVLLSPLSFLISFYFFLSVSEQWREHQLHHTSGLTSPRWFRSVVLPCPIYSMKPFLESHFPVGMPSPLPRYYTARALYPQRNGP